MEPQEQSVVRTASYLATRHDARGRLTTRTGKTRSGVNCNPPNQRCGNRCIPPSWDCRLQGKGTNSELSAHKTDPLAGIASIQRGSKDLARGIATIDPSRLQRGRSSIIRGVVKLTPGDNLEQKKRLKRQLNELSTPVAAIIGVGLVGASAHFGLKRGFESYRKGLGADIDSAAARAVDTVLDRLPGTAGPRAARRAAATAAAADIAGVVTRGSRLEMVRTTAAGNTRRIGPLSFRPVSANYEASNLVNQLNELQTKARSGSLSYDGYLNEGVQLLYGAQSPGTRARGQRGSVFSEHAANEFLVAKFGLRGSGAVGTQGNYSMAARNALVDAQLGDRLRSWGDAMREDMRLRRMTGDGAVDRYITEVGGSITASRLPFLSAAQQAQAKTETERLMRSVLTSSNPVGEARALRRELVSQYDTYFASVAQGMRRNAAAADSPFGDGLVGFARYVTRREGRQAQVLSRDHADLILRNHFHTKVAQLKTDYSIGDNTARRIAQQITRSTALPDTDSAFRVLQQNGFPQLSRGGVSAGRAAPKPLSLAEITRNILARPGNEGMSRAAAQREARKQVQARGQSAAVRGTVAKPATTSPSLSKVNNSRPKQTSNSLKEKLTESDLINNSPFSDPKKSREWAREMWLKYHSDSREDARLGKPCGESHIPKSHECRKGSGTPSSAEPRSQLDKKAVAAVLAAGAVAATGVYVFKDLKRVEREGNMFTPSPSVRTVIKEAKKTYDTKKSGTAMGNYYTKQSGLKPGDVVYYRDARDPAAHFGVFIGEGKDGKVRAVMANTNEKRAGFVDVIEVGTTKPDSNDASHFMFPVLQKAPPLKGAQRLSNEETVRRALRTIGTDYKFSLTRDNCEVLANSIAYQAPRSQQLERFKRVTRQVADGTIGVRQRTAGALRRARGQTLTRALTSKQILDRLSKDDSTFLTNEGRAIATSHYSQFFNEGSKLDSLDAVTQTLLTPEQVWQRIKDYEVNARAVAMRDYLLLVRLTLTGTDSSPEREDARLGKPCGESHIPKAHECRKSKAPSKAAVAGAALGVAALTTGAVLLARRRPGYAMSKGFDPTHGLDAGAPDFGRQHYDTIRTLGRSYSPAEMAEQLSKIADDPLVLKSNIQRATAWIEAQGIGLKPSALEDLPSQTKGKYAKALAEISDNSAVTGAYFDGQDQNIWVRRRGHLDRWSDDAPRAAIDGVNRTINELRRAKDPSTSDEDFLSAINAIGLMGRGMSNRSGQDLVTFSHELGHSAHFHGTNYGAAPIRTLVGGKLRTVNPRSPEFDSQLSLFRTKYGETNLKEAFAEAHVAYLFAGRRLRREAPLVHAWIEFNYDQALQRTRPRRSR